MNWFKAMSEPGLPKGGRCVVNLRHEGRTWAVTHACNTPIEDSFIFIKQVKVVLQ